jgi:hypothetical protein
MRKPTATEAHYQGLLGQLCDNARPKSAKEAILREVRAYERAHGLQGRNYNGE